MNLLKFVRETPDSFLQQKVIDLDSPLYIPCHLVPTEKKENPRGGKDICVPTNVPCYLNNQSCSNEGYTLISNGYKGMGRKTENVSAYYKYTIRCQHVICVARGSTSEKYKQGESSATLLVDKKCGFSIITYFKYSTKRFFIHGNSGRNFVHNRYSPVQRDA